MASLPNLAQRVLTAVVALPVVVALVLWRRTWGFSLLVLGVVGLGLGEYAGIALRGRPAREQAPVVVVGVALAVALVCRPQMAYAWIVLAVMAVGAAVLVQPGEMESAAARLGVACFGVLYLGGLAPALVLLHRGVADGPRWVLAALGATFAADTGAYFTGKAIGRHKLHPRVSPGKTVEGVAGALFASVGFLALARATFFPGLSLPDCPIVGVPAALLGAAGDLVESMLKRSAGVKDSGRLVPGHGGILDRIDALLFVGAWVFVYASYLR